MCHLPYYKALPISVGVFFISVFYTGPVQGTLIFPVGDGTNLQFTATLSVPVELVDGRNMFVDVGFQVYYSTLNNITLTYNSPIWADMYSRRKRDLLNNIDNFNTLSRNEVHPNDYTAGELYTAFENILDDYGFHKSCMLRSVCELALHPLDKYHSYNVVLELLTFLLTPSQHNGFAKTEREIRKRYEHAERIGFLGGDCAFAYLNCERDILSLFTKLNLE